MWIGLPGVLVAVLIGTTVSPPAVVEGLPVRVHRDGAVDRADVDRPAGRVGGGADRGDRVAGSAGVDGLAVRGDQCEAAEAADADRPAGRVGGGADRDELAGEDLDVDGRSGRAVRGWPGTVTEHPGGHRDGDGDDGDRRDPGDALRCPASAQPLASADARQPGIYPRRRSLDTGESP
jgi:hypothetical protein